MNERANFFGALDAFAQLNATAHINRIRVYLRDCIDHVVAGQAARQYQRLGQIVRNKRPVETGSRPAGNARYVGIE
ncbi:hypothetical protein DP64_14275 [Stutzerimonas degradans]|nr:hypothetical protein DP64_14275 [Stutzerimonas degradans]